MKILDKLLVGLFWMTMVGILGVLMYFIIGAIVRTPNILIKEDAEYLYYKEYELYNRDSCIYKYHKPIIYDGKIVDKISEIVNRSHMQGIPGKGGHWVYSTDRVYRTYIKYDGNKEYIENGMDFYSNHKIGDKVKIKVEFYPYERIYLID